MKFQSHSKYLFRYIQNIYTAYIFRSLRAGVCDTHPCSLTYVQSSRLTGVLLSCSVISCCVLTTKSLELGWPGLGAAGTTPSCWYKH